MLVRRGRKHKKQHGPGDQLNARVELAEFVDQPIMLGALGRDMLALQKTRAIDNPRQAPGQHIHKIADGNQDEDWR